MEAVADAQVAGLGGGKRRGRGPFESRAQNKKSTMEFWGAMTFDPAGLFPFIPILLFNFSYFSNLFTFLPR